MNTYYHTVTNEVRDFDPAWFEAMTAAGNPKVEGWVLRPNPPSHEAATQNAPQWIEGAWVISDKTIEQLAAETRKVWPNGEAFLRGMTLEELAAISLSTDPTIAALRLLLVARQAEVWSDDQELNLGLNRLVQLNLLTVERKTSILTQ